MDIQEAYNDLVMNMMPQPINQIDTIDMHEHLFNDLYNGEIKTSLLAWLQISSSVDRLASLRKILMKSVQRKQDLISIRLEQRIGKMLQYLNEHLQQSDIIKKFVKSLKIYTTINIVNNEAMQQTFKKALFTFSRNLKFENIIELFKFLRSYAGNKEYEQFCLMLLQLWNWIENQEKPKPNMKLCEQLPQLNEEKVLIIKWQLLRFFSNLKNSQFKTIQIQDQSQKILETLKTNPYKQLLVHVITKDCSNESSSRLVQQILQFTLETDQKKPYYKFRTEKVRADLLTCQVIELAIKQTYFGLSRLLQNESIAVKENGLVSKYTLRMLAEISEKVQKQSNFELDVVYIIAQLFKKVLQHEHKQILYYTDKQSMEIQGQNVRIQYACSLFLILIKYFHTFIEEDSAIELGNTINLNLFTKFITALLKDKGIKQKPIFQKVLQSIYSFCVIVPTRRSFQQLVTYDSEISKLIKDLMLQSKQMPRKWEILRSMRSIFLKWNENVNIQQNPQFKQIINRFFQAYLDKKLILPTSVRSIFSNYNINKSLSAYCLVKITEELKKFITVKEQSKQYIPQQQTYLHKIMLMINPRFKGKTEEMFENLKKIYDNYAHEHQCIHHYRTWIIQNTKIERQIQLSLLQSKLAYFRDSLTALVQINNKQPQQIEFWLSKNKTKNVQNAFAKKLNDVVNSSNNLVNSLQIKSSKYEANAKFYEMLIQSLLSLNKLVFDISNKLLLYYRKKSQLEQDILQATFGNLSNFATLQRSCRNLQLTLRYYLLNNDQMISGAEQFFIMSQLGQLFLQIGGQGRRQKLIIQGHQKQQKQIQLTENGRILALLVNILGLEKLNGSHHLQKMQFFSRKQRGRAQDMRTISLKRTNQLPLNLFTSFYQVTNTSIFNCFIKLDQDSKEFEKTNLKYYQKNYQSQQAAKNTTNDWICMDIISQKDLISTIIEERKTIKNGPKNKDNKISLVRKPKFQVYANLLKSYLIFPSLQVGGQAWFNGKIHSESKQDMAYAVLHHQFQTIVKKKDINYLIMFQQYFSKFFENLNNKTIVSLASKAQQVERFGGMRGRPPPPRDIQRIRNQIISMGYPEEVVELVLENNQILETDQALQWIDMNRNQLDHIMIDRLEQRSRHNRGSNRQVVSSVQYDNNIKLESMNINIFWEKIDAFLKQLTKLLFGQVFSEIGKKVTKLLFICLSAFRKADFKSRQYTNLSKKMFQIVNQCGNIFENPKDVTNKLKIAISILLESIQNDQKSCKQFLQKSIGTKLLVLLPKMNDNLEQFSQTIQDILKLINLNLPVIDLKKQSYANQLKDYMHFICNVFMNINLKSNLLTPILYKIASMKDPELVEKVIKVLCYQLSLGNLSSHVFPLLVLINESNTSFVEGAMQQDIKGFILQNYGYKNTGVIEVDTRLFSLSMKAYDQRQSFVLVSKRLFQRKAKSNVKFIYNCEQHNLLTNETLNSQIIKYEQNSTQRVVIDCLINLLKTQEKKQNSIQYLRQLRKILQYYKILIPYTVQKRIQIRHKTLQKQIEYGFISWILNVYCLQVDIQSGMQFVEFMMLNNNIFINQRLDSFGDYVISETIANLPFLREQYELLPNKEQLKKISLFFIIYFLQNKKFMDASQQAYSVQNPQSLKGYLQRSIDITLQKEDNPQKSSIKMTTYALQMEAISLINRYSIIKASIEHKFYKFVEENETQNEKQYVPIDIMFQGQSFEQIKENNNSRFKQEQRIADQVAQGEGEEQQQSDNQQEEGIAQERLFARNRQFLSRNWMLGQDDSTLIIGGQRVNSLNFFQPIQQQKKQQQGADKKDKQKMQIEPQEKKPQEQSEQQKQIQIIEQKKVQKYQITILQEVRKALPVYQEILITFDKPALILPERQIKISNQNIPLKIVIAQPKVIIENTYEKVKIFITRIALCFKLIYPFRNWAINESEDPTKKKITVRLSENIRGLGQLREQMMMHIQRLLNRRRVQEGNTQTVRPLNVGPILQGMTEYIQPPKQQKKQENAVQQKVTEKMEIQQKPEKKQQIPAENMQIQQKQGQNEQDKNQEQIKPEEKIQGNQPQQKSQMQLQEPVQSLSQLQQLQNIQQNIQLLEGSEPIQEENVDHLEVPVQPQPIIQRQILAMLGLPQSFLRDIGVDEELFDQLPEQEQIYQLTQLRNSQQPNNSQQNAQGQASQNIPGSQPYNQNAVLFASMDPGLRAQLLLQATPQVLATLPPQMRAQAENIRQRQLNQIIRQQQMEDQQSYMKGKKIPKNLKYPKIPKSIYPNIEQPLIKQSMQGLYISIKKFRIQNYRFLLENKKTRQQAISSLICFLRDQESIKSSNWYQCSNKLKDNNEGCQWAVQVSDFSKNHKFKKGLLQLIYEVLMYSPIKDRKIFSKRISRNGFGNMKVQISELSYGDEQTYQPSLQLLQLSLNNHSGLAIEMMKFVKKIPFCILEKIVGCMKKGKLLDQFYEHMQVLSDSSQMKELIEKQFPQNSPPKFELLAKILKYNFSRLSYLHKLHEEALTNYNPSYNEFLNQIFHIYGKQDIKKIEPMLLNFKKIHFEVIKHLYATGRPLDNQPLGIILKFPNLLDFETKKFLFRKHPKIKNTGRFRLAIEVSRQNIFQDSFNQIMSKSSKELQGRIQVTFIDEPGYDAGGLARQWFEKVSKEIFKLDYALFQRSSSGNTYQPNPKSYINPDHVNYFKFIGRFVGKALTEGMLLDSYFTRAFYKVILGQQLQFSDLQQQDYNFYRSMQWMKTNNITDIIDENFCYLYDNFGKKQIKQIIPGGKAIPVTEDNKHEYIEKYCLNKMRDDFSLQMKNFMDGFNDVVPNQCISFFEAKELQLLISGLPSIDISDMKSNTDYSGYAPDEQIIKWFWEVVEGYTQDQIAKLLQFITGTSRIPAGGFSQLVGMNGLQRISIHRDPNTHQLPKAHTCFNQLDLPNYPTKEMLKQRLRIAITEGHEGFGFM